MQHIGTVSRPRLILAAALTAALAIGGLLPWRVVAQSGASVSTSPTVTQKEEVWQEKEQAYFTSRNAELDAQLAAILKPLSPARQKKVQADIAFMTADVAKGQQHIQMLEQHRADYLAAHPNRLSDAQIALVQKVNWDKLDPSRIDEGIRWEQTIKRKLQAHLEAAHDARSKQGWQRQITAIDQRRRVAERQIRELGPVIARQEANVASIPEDQRARVTKLRSYDSEISAYRNIALMDKQMRIAFLRQQIAGTLYRRRQSQGATTKASLAQSVREGTGAAQANHPTSAPVQVSPAMAEALDKQIAQLEKQQRASTLAAYPRGDAGEWTVIGFLKARRAGAAWAQASIASPEFSPGVKGQKLDNLRRIEREAQQNEVIAEKYVFLLATMLIMQENHRTPMIYYFAPHGTFRVRIFAQDATGRHFILDKLSHGKTLIIPSVPMKEGSKLNFLVYDNGKQVREWWL